MIYSNYYYLYIIVLVTYVTVKGQATRRNHGDKVKLRPQFCKWRSQKGREELEN